MNNKAVKILTILTLALGALTCFGQSVTITNPVTAVTNLPAPFQQATNQSAALAVFNAALALLPAWDPTQTNDFESGEVTIESAPVWKSMTAAGTTPYNSTEADYFFSRNFAAGGELISLGNGSGNNTIDTVNIAFTARKDVGNIAGYLLLNGGRGFNFIETNAKGKQTTSSGWEGAFGPGLIYQYQTHLRLFLDTRYEFGQKSAEDGFLTRVGLQIPF